MPTGEVRDTVHAMPQANVGVEKMDRTAMNDGAIENTRCKDDDEDEVARERGFVASSRANIRRECEVTRGVDTVSAISFLRYSILGHCEPVSVIH